MQKFFVREKSFYKSFLTLTLFIMLQNLISFSVNLADNLMLGAYNETALSGASIVNQVQFLLQMIVSGFASGVVAIGSQYWGKGETKPIKKIIAIGLPFALFVGVVFTLASIFIPRQIISILTNEEAVIQEGLKYIRIMAYTYIVYALSNMLSMSLRAVESTVISMIMSLSTLIINVALNYILIFGKFGAPEMGITGAAIATLTSRIIELVIIVIYILFVDKKLHLRVADFLRLSFTFLKSYLRVALPLVGSGAMWGIANNVQTAILGHMSAEAIAANSVAGTIFQVISVIGLSTANSSAVIIGKAVGEGKTDMIRAYSRTMQVMFVGFGLFSGALLMLLKTPLLGLFTLGEETRELANAYVIVLVFATIGASYQYAVSGGIIQGGGDTRYVLIIDTIFMWCLTLPLAALSAFVWHMSPVWTFIFLKSDQLLKCIPNGIYCNRYKWIRNLSDTKE